LARLHEQVLSVFLQLESRKEISKAELARRLNKDPAVINRWLSGPGNWELRTVSDLLAGMGYEPDVRIAKVGTTSDQQSDVPSLPNRPGHRSADNDQDFHAAEASNWKQYQPPHQGQTDPFASLGQKKIQQSA
jgi:hypothetical protein